MSALAGVFIQKRPEFSENYKNINGYRNAVYFAPWISLERDFKLSGGIHAFVSVSSNYALTHAVTGLKYKF